ncbi:MAG: hypothetical protein ACTS6H_00890 [Candidatus Hodgkinia cicadicola]
MRLQNLQSIRLVCAIKWARRTCEVLEAQTKLLKLMELRKCFERFW